jgi:single-stranded DNA-binding protein
MQMLGSRGEGGGGAGRGASRPASNSRSADQDSYDEYSAPSPAGFPDDEIPF